MFGSKVRRLEDPALLRGQGRYVDDIQLPGLLHARFVRSSFAHAAIRDIALPDLSGPGFSIIYRLQDVKPHLSTTVMPVEQPSAALRLSASPPVLADREVRYVGEPLACVIADCPYRAEDIAGSITVDYEPLPVSSNALEAAGAQAPPAHSGFSHNIVAAFCLEYGDCESPFTGETRRIRETLHQHKGLGHPMECRGVVAVNDPVRDVLTVWSGTQMAHRAQGLLSRLLEIPEDNVRVIAPHVGGGFGPKFVFYQEEVVIPLAAMLLNRPVKWIEDRREHFTATTMERDQHWDLEAAIDTEGRILAVRGSMIHDHGAYTPYGVNLPYNSATNFLGPYVVPALSLDVTLTMTNMTPVTPVRGAGRPQGTFAMERLMDRISRDTGIDRSEIRRRNLIERDRMPYATPVKTRDGSTMTYDSGDYPGAMEAALRAADYRGFRDRQHIARRDGRHIGIGVGNYVEGTGRGPFESAVVRVKSSGRVGVYTGATDQGQGLRTVLAQICSEQLGVGLDMIDVVSGDSAVVSSGLGAFASRQAVTAGSSVLLAARNVRDKALRVAAELLEAAREDLELSGGQVSVRGIPGLSVRLDDIARAVQGMPGFSLPGGVEPGLEAAACFSPDTLTYCNGVHVAEVEVDAGTGQVRILAYTIVHDSGRLINPLIVDGQIAGGAVHGIGCSLFEQMIFDELGQPLSTNFGEYLLPTAPEVPSFNILHMESPTPLNPLGVKGAGEGGIIPVTATMASAVEDALSPFGVVINELPMAPHRLVELIRRASKKNDAGSPDGLG